MPSETLDTIERLLLLDKAEIFAAEADKRGYALSVPHDRDSLAHLSTSDLRHLVESLRDVVHIPSRR